MPTVYPDSSIKYPKPPPKILYQLSTEFIRENHIMPITMAAKDNNFAVSFRAAGAHTLKALSDGAAAKGHDILEKTISRKSILTTHSMMKMKIWRELEETGLAGYVGSWGEDNQLKGVHVVKNHPLYNKLQLDKNGIYPINTDDLRQSIANLTSVEKWQTLLYAGDYDMHDLITFRGAGRPRTVMSHSKEEKEIIAAINKKISEIDPTRKPMYERAKYAVIQHGPQVNYVSYMLAKEKTKVDQAGGFLKAVACAGEFPIAMCDRGRWEIIHDMRQLEAFYVRVKAVMKETWREEGARGYQPLPEDDNTVKLARKWKPRKPAMPK